MSGGITDSYNISGSVSIIVVNESTVVFNPSFPNVSNIYVDTLHYYTYSESDKTISYVWDYQLIDFYLDTLIYNYGNDNMIFSAYGSNKNITYKMQIHSQ